MCNNPLFLHSRVCRWPTDLSSLSPLSIGCLCCHYCSKWNNSWAQTQEKQALRCKYDWGQDEADYIHCVVWSHTGTEYFKAWGATSKFLVFVIIIVLLYCFCFVFPKVCKNQKKYLIVMVASLNGSGDDVHNLNGTPRHRRDLREFSDFFPSVLLPCHHWGHYFQEICLIANFIESIHLTQTDYFEFLILLHLSVHFFPTVLDLLF